MSVYAVFDANGRNPAFYVVGLNCDAPPAGSVEITEAERDAWVANPGAFRWDGSQIVAYAPPVEPPPPPDISDRQFARGLWGDSIITYADFLGFIGPGTIPAPIQAIVSQLPDDDTGKPTARKDAVGFLTGSKLYEFGHPLVEFFREKLAAEDPKWTVDYLRSRWLYWATL